MTSVQLKIVSQNLLNLQSYSYSMLILTESLC